MKITINSIIAIFLLTIIISCNKNDNKDDNLPKDPVPILLSEKQVKLISSDNSFGLRLFQEINKTTDNKTNLMISPLSVSYALGMVYNGAAGDTKNAMKSTLGYTDLTDDAINISYKDLMNSLLTVDPRVNINIANSIWYRNNFDVLQPFIDLNKTYFNAEVTKLDFANPGSKSTINNWVASKTNNKITEIIEQINPLDVMYLINAVYFKGTWKYQFDKSKTSDKPFNFEDGTMKQVPTMYAKTNAGYLENDLFKSVELSYGSGNYSMVIMMPVEGKKVNDIINQLSAANWNNWISSMVSVKDFQVYMPSFKFEYKILLNDFLKSLGMSIAFSPSNADFSGINANARSMQLYISKVNHKTYIEVNEEGTEAAAVTSVTMGLTSVGPTQILSINKPFVYVIKEKYTNAILFLGKVLSL